MDSFLQTPELYSWALPRRIPDLYQFLVCDCKSQFLELIFPHLKSVAWLVWSYGDKVYSRSVASSIVPEWNQDSWANLASMCLKYWLVFMSYCIGENDLGIWHILLLVNGFDVSIDSILMAHSLIHSTLVPFSHHNKQIQKQYQSNCWQTFGSAMFVPCCSCC